MVWNNSNFYSYICEKWLDVYVRIRLFIDFVANRVVCRAAFYMISFSCWHFNSALNSIRAKQQPFFILFLFCFPFSSNIYVYKCPYMSSVNNASAVLYADTVLYAYYVGRLYYVHRYWYFLCCLYEYRTYIVHTYFSHQPARRLFHIHIMRRGAKLYPR